MKRSILIILATCGVVLFAGSAWSYFVETTNVGAMDTLKASARLPDSGYKTELAWVKSLLGQDYFFADTESEKYNVSESDFSRVSSVSNGAYINGMYAIKLQDSPAYFFIKIGEGGLGPSDPDHFLFTNLGDLQWAVIALSGAGFTIKNSGAISHIGEVNRLPEPVTLILLGAGLIGLAGIRRLK
jgi:hypothetical protein